MYNCSIYVGVRSNVKFSTKYSYSRSMLSNAKLRRQYKHCHCIDMRHSITSINHSPEGVMINRQCGEYYYISQWASNKSIGSFLCFFMLFWFTWIVTCPNVVRLKFSKNTQLRTQSHSILSSIKPSHENCVSNKAINTFGTQVIRAKLLTKFQWIYTNRFPRIRTMVVTQRFYDSSQIHFFCACCSPSQWNKYVYYTGWWV